jgi:2-polyprenyl-3-methyl-5-hydroxy-6-metoxy-1,4-benzoquinol methylase
MPITAPCKICNICSNPSTFEEATSLAKVSCHVRSHKEDSFTVWRCKNCNSLHSLESVYLEFYYSDYPFKRHTLDFHTRVGYKNRIKLLKALGIQKENSILDFGCGKGLFVQALKQAGYNNAYGYDFFIPEYSDQAILQKKFDVVVSYDVIEHVEEPRQFLHMLKGLLAPNGILHLTTPNADEIDFAKIPAQPELSQPFHRHIFSQAALINMAKEINLEVTTTSDRFYFDTLVPGVNTRFMWACLNAKDGMLDSAVEPPPWNKILCSPRLVFLAFFGYFLRMPGNMSATFRNTTAEPTQQVDSLHSAL